MANRGLNSCQPLSTMFLTTSQYITLFYKFLGRDTLFTIQCWLVSPELMASRTVPYAWTKLILIHIFPPQGTSTALYSATLDGTRAPVPLGAIWNSKTINKIDRNVSSLALNRGQLFTSWGGTEAEHDIRHQLGICTSRNPKFSPFWLQLPMTPKALG